VLNLYFKYTTNKEILINDKFIQNYIHSFTADEAINDNFGYVVSCFSYIPKTAKWLSPMSISFNIKLVKPFDKFCERELERKTVKEMIHDSILHDSLEDGIYEGMPGNSLWVVPFGGKRVKTRDENPEEIGLIDYRRKENILIS
jgi:hypothetical protein